MKYTTYIFNSLYIAIAVNIDNQYLTSCNPTTKNISLFFTERAAEQPGSISYEEVIQRAQTIIESVFILPSTMFIDPKYIDIVHSITDKQGNLLLCVVFNSTVDIEDFMEIQLRDGNPNMISLYNINEASNYRNKDYYTEKLLSLLS